MATFVNGLPSPSIRTRGASYNPTAERDLSPYSIGKYRITRTVEPGSPYVRHTVRLKGVVIGRLITPPDKDQCDSLKHQRDAAALYEIAKDEVSESVTALSIQMQIQQECAVKWKSRRELRLACKCMDTTITPILSRLVAQGELQIKGDRDHQQYKVAA